MARAVATFGFKEPGLKLDVTTWVPRFMQSACAIRHSQGIYSFKCIYSFLLGRKQMLQILISLAESTYYHTLFYVIKVNMAVQLGKMLERLVISQSGIRGLKD